MLSRLVPDGQLYLYPTLLQIRIQARDGPQGALVKILNPRADTPADRRHRPRLRPVAGLDNESWTT